MRGLEAQLDKWVGIAELLASELAYREKRLWDWQMDNTNTKAVLQKFKDRLKGGKGGGSGGDGGSGGSFAKKFGRGANVVESRQSAQPVKQMPTSAAGIGMLIVEADEGAAKALADTCRDIGYKVTTVALRARRRWTSSSGKQWRQRQRQR